MRTFKPFSLELTLITDRLDTVTAITFDTGTEENSPPSVRLRGVAGKTPVMICVLQRPIQFEEGAANQSEQEVLTILDSVSRQI